MTSNTQVKLRPDEWEALNNGVTVTACIGSDDPDEKYREVDILPPR